MRCSPVRSRVRGPFILADSGTVHGMSINATGAPEVSESHPMQKGTPEK
jgi:hypothetical protein